MISSSTILLDIIGPEKMEEVCHRLGNDRISIPGNINDLQRNDNIKIEVDNKLQNGSTCMGAYEQLSREFDLSPRQVMRIIQKK